MSQIDTPGVYEMDAETYHKDPCISPSLSSGMINDILEAPAKCFTNSRRLNPDWEEPPGAERFSIGTVSHVMFLEPQLFAEKVVVVQADDWRTNAAKASRDAAKAAGKTPILARHMEKVRAARKAFFANPFTAAAFQRGTFERSLFWRHPKHGFWCRARADFIADALSHMNDYKATQNANPEDFPRHAYQMGYHRRAAWYLEGAEIVFGKRPRNYWFVNQETSAPYLTSVVELDSQSLDAGKFENDRAADLFARCLESGEWFGYRQTNNLERDLAFRVSLPHWALMQIDQRA